ncbi:MAG TPA: hypothetical protein VEL71_01280 [Candidatus Dormibacteraeota bacterium]|nr:hypothetical protein [Candidatus Dormibacteraeota bacterium]
MMASFSASSTMEIFQAKSFVTRVIFVSLVESSKHSRIEAENIVAREIRRFAVANGASNSIMIL